MQQKIRFSGSGATNQNGAAECAIKTLVTMERTMLVHYALRFPKDPIFTDIWSMEMDYDIWVYNRIPDIQSRLSAIEIQSRSKFERVSETLRKFHTWGCPTYFLEPKLQKPGVNVLEWSPRIQRGVNIGFSKMHSTQVGLVINLLTGPILLMYHIVFDDILSTVVSSTAVDTVP